MRLKLWKLVVDVEVSRRVTHKIEYLRYGVAGKTTTETADEFNDIMWGGEVSVTKVDGNVPNRSPQL